ncbi:MAG: UDP-N-acetylmuramyl-tripeptide synthetase [Candidatus Brennerbacteria bacterium]|nr:UDP-N-acetylmuramyl-tripeptide synthetase [Candidatus Brennerbacteria bacterium]
MNVYLKLKSFYHLALAWLGNLIYRNPSRKLFVLGVTGTKGKSTVLELINAMLESAGKKTALLSSIRIKISLDSDKNTSGNTMPGRFFIQRFLRRAADAGCKFALIEVTSQGVLQHRHRFIKWDAALVTNIAPEHIEAHGSFENYLKAKTDFFNEASKSKQQPLFFINKEMSQQEYFIEACHGKGIQYFFSRDDFVREELGKSYDLETKKDRRLVSDWLMADFNLENAAAATAVAKVIGISWPVIKQTLESFKGVSGRLEYVQKKPFGAVIDYAHTPDSLEKVYQHLKVKNLKLKTKLLCVLGSAGGGRDKWKRPLMGKIAAQYCDYIVLTDEDPYDENSFKIISEIKSGITDAGFPAPNLFEVLNRREAIKKAISLAKKNDVVVMTGKGSEPWLHLAKGKKIPWNEKEVVEGILKSASVNSGQF